MNDVRMLCFGDFLLEEELLKTDGSEEILNLINKRDIITFNLETTVSDKPGVKVNKAYNFKINKANLDILTKNIKADVVCNIGNNHIMDYGYECFEDTLFNLKNHQISFTGYSENMSIPEGILLKNIKGVRIAFLGAYSQHNVTAQKPGLTVIDDSLYEKVKYASKISDYVIVHLHWGEELSLCQNPKQVRIAHKLVDCGADIILGHHPHVIQEVEKYKDAVIAYSVGNFQMMTYDYDYNSKFGIMLDLQITDQKVKYEIIPLFIKDRVPRIIKDKKSEVFQYYKEIRAQNAYYSKNNNWVLFFYHASKPFYVDSVKAWKRRKDKGEQKLLYKKIRWFLSKWTLAMTLMLTFNILLHNRHKSVIIKKYKCDFDKNCSLDNN